MNKVNKKVEQYLKRAESAFYCLDDVYERTVIKNFGYWMIAVVEIAKMIQIQENYDK